MEYLLTDRGKSELKALLTVPSLFAFDFDGTLAKIVRDRHTAQLGRPIRIWLGELAKCAPTAIISGRSVEDLRTRIGNTVPYLIGNHGLEGLHVTQQVVQQARDTCKGWKQLIEERFGTELTRCGVFVEDKSYSLSFHYRNAGQKDDARALVFQVLAELSPLPRIVLGKAVVNVVPASAPHKGAALLELMHQLNCTAALYIGDDDTDEDVMKDSLREEIKRVLKSLSPREAEIVNAYFGLDGENGVTIEQIGQKYDLTKERIRQIKERAIKRLQKARYSSALKAYLG
jgi:trehalose-phosphatase